MDELEDQSFPWKIVEYSVVSAETVFHLTLSVQRAIRDGFQPLGGITHVQTPDGNLFYQAVVMYEGEDKRSTGITG